MEKLIERINELAKKSKTIGLNEEEKIEQAKLRKDYIDIFKGNMKNTLLNVKVVDEDGADITPEKLKDEQKINKMN